MKIVGIVIFLLGGLLAAERASAILLFCPQLVKLSPVHPLHTDRIQFEATLVPITPLDASGNARIVLSKATFTTSNEISLNIVATTDTRPFPDYETDTLVPGQASFYATGNIGSLPPGEYRVTATIRVYDAATGSLSSPCPTISTSVKTLTVYATSGIAPVIEFYHAGLDHYFLTQDANEIHDLDTAVHAGWGRTGQSFLAYLPGQTNGQVPPVMRFYGLPSAELDTHLFTIGVTPEVFSLRVGPLSATWALETFDAFELYSPSYTDGTCRPGTVPVYRLWNQRVDSNHRYTTDPSIKAEMIARGYVAEGWGSDVVFMCAFAGS